MTLTAAQIVTDACQIAKCPGYTAQGGRALNLVLADLQLHRNLKANLTTAFASLPAGTNGPLTLEVDYLRTYDLFYVLAGETYFLMPGSLREYDADVTSQQGGGQPYEWASDLSVSPGLLYIYPQSTKAVTLTHRYYNRETDIVAPESSAVVPWFADQDYLIQATAARLMRITDDDRYQACMADCEKLLQIHLLTEGDEQQVVKEVQLDPRRFRIRGGSRPTKDNPW